MVALLLKNMSFVMALELTPLPFLSLPPPHPRGGAS